MVKNKYLKDYKTILVTLTLVYLFGLATNNGFKIYTCFWHLTNSNPINWENVMITVPKTLKGNFFYNDKNRKNFKIYFAENPERATIFFDRTLYISKEGIPFEKKILARGYKIFEKQQFEIFGNQCIWIKSGAKKESAIANLLYFEDIFFISHDLHITFVGWVNERNYLLEIIKNLKFI